MTDNVEGTTRKMSRKEPRWLRESRDLVVHAEQDGPLKWKSARAEENGPVMRKVDKSKCPRLEPRRERRSPKRSNRKKKEINIPEVGGSPRRSFDTFKDFESDGENRGWTGKEGTDR